MQLTPPAMQAQLAGSQPRTRRSSAQAPQSHSKTQMQLTVPLLPYLLGPLNATEKSSQQFNVALHGAQISEETLVPSYVIEQLQLQLMPADNSICYCYCLNSMQAAAHIPAIVLRGASA